jgi:hypothetical protein
MADAERAVAHSGDLADIRNQASATREALDAAPGQGG